MWNPLRKVPTPGQETPAFSRSIRRYLGRPAADTLVLSISFDFPTLSLASTNIRQLIFSPFYNSTTLGRELCGILFKPSPTSYPPRCDESEHRRAPGDTACRAVPPSRRPPCSPSTPPPPSPDPCHCALNTGKARFDGVSPASRLGDPASGVQRRRGQEAPSPRR